MTIGCHHGNECQNLWTGWFLIKNGCTTLIDRSAISSTQQEVLGAITRGEY